MARTITRLATLEISQLIGPGQTARRIADAALIALIAMMGIIGILRGFDASELISADSLYPVQLLDFPLLDFRPPPPNRLFPDVAVHALLQWVGGPLEQKLAAGLVLFALTVVTIGVFKGPVVFASVAVLLGAGGSEAVNSATHYTLPLLVLISQMAGRWRAADAIVLFLVAFSNILVLIPLTVLLLDPTASDRLRLRAAAALSGLTAAALYSDLGVAFVQVALVLPAWAVAVLIAQRLGLRDALVLATIVVLVAAALLGFAPSRYAYPVSAALIVAISPVSRPTFDWRFAIVPAAIVALFLATLDTHHARQTMRDFDCVAAALSERGISNVATDHWTAKPLYFAARSRGQSLTITQTDFREGDTHPWMAPYAFFGAPTSWALRSSSACRRVHDDPTYCGQGHIAAVVKQEAICGEFSLYHYDRAVPLTYEAAPRNKIDAIQRQARSYASKAKAIVSRTLGAQ